MAISDNNKKFLDDLIQYYINESESYKQFANEYKEFSKSGLALYVGKNTHGHTPRRNENIAGNG